VAAKMPHTMPLILKTNNLLRGIEFQLGTYNRKDAFLEVGICCVSQSIKIPEKIFWMSNRAKLSKCEMKRTAWTGPYMGKGEGTPDEEVTCQWWDADDKKRKKSDEIFFIPADVLLIFGLMRE
jgi:hypothetical protein